MNTHLNDDIAVQAEGLVKVFGNTKALDGVDLAVRRGTVLRAHGPRVPVRDRVRRPCRRAGVLRGAARAAGPRHVRGSGLAPGELLGFDNLALAHGRRGVRQPGELHQRVFGHAGLAVPEQVRLRDELLAAFA